MTPFLAISEAARFLGVCTKTLRRWDAAGLFRPAYRTPGGHRRYALATLRTLAQAPPTTSGRSPSPPPAPRPLRAAVYARVSSSRQKTQGDLHRQLEELRRFCHTHRYQLVREFSDVGSGVNDTRQGLHRLIRAVSRGQCDRVIIAYPDRLARFGINVLKACFAEWGVQVELTNPHPLGASKESALITDITAILYSYMGKLYRLRKRT
ncbi:MAG: IS607 family transposase [Candidatus Helarchaeota archaeon]